MKLKTAINLNLLKALNIKSQPNVNIKRELKKKTKIFKEFFKTDYLIREPIFESGDFKQ